MQKKTVPSFFIFFNSDANVSILFEKQANCEKNFIKDA